MNILFLHAKQDIRDLLVFPLESKFSAKVEGIDNAEAAIKLLENKDTKYDYVILENQPEVLKKIISALQRKLPQPYVILCDKDPLENKSTLTGCNLLGIAKYDSLLQDIVSLISEASLEKESEEGYTRIGLGLLARLQSLEAEVFVRLSAKHFVKVFHAQEKFEETDLSRFSQKKNITHLFLPNADSSKLVSRFDRMLQDMLKLESLSMNDAGDAIVDSVATIQELVHKLGITPEVQTAVKSTVSVTLKALGDFPQLSELTQDLQKNKNSYVAAHSLQLAHIACAMAVAAEWYSEATFEKLSMAAFLHDLPIKDDKLCAVTGLVSLKNRAAEFSPKQVQEYRAHPEKSAENAQKFSELPTEVDTIILQHHERPDGSGFPNGLKATQLSPLSSLFIVAHDYLDYIQEKDSGASMEGFLSKHADEYSQGNFKKIAKAIVGLKIKN